VSHLWFGFGKFPLKMSNFSIFFPLEKKKSLRVGSKSIRVKGWSASYLLRVKSKLASGQGPSLESYLTLQVPKSFGVPWHQRKSSHLSTNLYLFCNIKTFLYYILHMSFVGNENIFSNKVIFWLQIVLVIECYPQ